MRNAEDLDALLRLNGFELKRRNKHAVWADASGNTFVCAATPSDYRALLNCKSDLKRVMRKGGREFMDLRDKTITRPAAPFNPPKTATTPSPPPSTTKTKQLDDEAFEFCKKAREDRRSQFWMAEALAAMGYVSLNDGPITNSVVSSFLRSRGVRSRERYDRATTGSSAGSKSKFIHDLTEILSSNLSDAMKERLVRAMVQEG